MIRSLFGCLLGLALVSSAGFSAPDSPATAPPPREKPATVTAPATPKLPLSRLAYAKPMFDACIYRYSVGTTNPKCQAYVNQALGMYYSYVWIEGVRAAETALSYDPECAYAWLILHRSFEKWGAAVTAPKPSLFGTVLGAAALPVMPEQFTKPPADYALEMARKLLPKASHREQLLIQSRLQEKGMWPGVGPDERKKKAQQTLDELLTLHDDDEEGWFWRAQLATGDGPNAASTFYKALLRVNPLHPGANHEFVHSFENIKRPALGWPYAEGYIKSSPGIPHAFHMQAHLGMRIGKWGSTTDWSLKAVELEMAYHKYQGVTPGEDHQFVHHMQTLTRSLVHDGRFAEAQHYKELAEGYKASFQPEWLQMAVLQKDWPAAQKIIDQYRRTDKSNGAYNAAIVFLEKGQTEAAGREIDTLRQVQPGRKSDKSAERKQWEVQGRYLCQKGDGESGLKLLKKLVDATKNDYNAHAWGSGAQFMEVWGVGALEAGDAAQAEEAFQEALAHDAGSVKGALGMWALCERQDRSEEAYRYLTLAQRIWSRAAPKDFENLKADMTRRANRIQKPTIAVTSQETGQ
jgi:tetratricopeptide (TPR) repeat protein